MFNQRKNSIFRCRFFVLVMISRYHLILLTVFTDFAYGNNESSSDLVKPRILDAETVAHRFQFPYVVRIYQKTTTSVTACTGTIIDYDMILTAAHCAGGSGKMMIVHGDPDHTDFVKSRHDCKWTEKYFCHKVQSVKIHPKYQKEPIQNDVAILKLESPMEFFVGNQVFSCSELGSDYPDSCMVLGWGISFRNISDNKLHYKEGISTRKCRKSGSKANHICLKGHHICKGDSGGPLICNNKIYGVASFTRYSSKTLPTKCEDYDEDFYTRTAQVRAFLMEHAGCKAPSIRRRHDPTIATILMHLIYFYFIMYG